MPDSRPSSGTTRNRNTARREDSPPVPHRKAAVPSTARRRDSPSPEPPRERSVRSDRSNGKRSDRVKLDSEMSDKKQSSRDNSGKSDGEKVEKNRANRPARAKIRNKWIFSESEDSSPEDRSDRCNSSAVGRGSVAAGGRRRSRSSGNDDPEESVPEEYTPPARHARNRSTPRRAPGAAGGSSRPRYGRTSEREESETESEGKMTSQESRTARQGQDLPGHRHRCPGKARLPVIVLLLTRLPGMPSISPE
jgi:hypothetical protein